MKPAIKKTGSKDGVTYVAKANARWGTPPDWVLVLAQHLDGEVAQGGSQATLGKKLGIDASVLSGIIGKKYPGKLDRHELTVRGKLMSATVVCPALGCEIGRDLCSSYQNRKLFSAANPQMVALSRRCPKCPNNVGAKG